MEATRISKVTEMLLLSKLTKLMNRKNERNMAIGYTKYIAPNAFALHYLFTALSDLEGDEFLSVVKCGDFELIQIPIFEAYIDFLQGDYRDNVELIVRTPVLVYNFDLKGAVFSIIGSQQWDLNYENMEYGTNDFKNYDEKIKMFDLNEEAINTMLSKDRIFRVEDKSIINACDKEFVLLKSEGMCTTKLCVINFRDLKDEFVPKIKQLNN